jgi:hypothetical protein
VASIDEEGALPLAVRSVDWLASLDQVGLVDALLDIRGSEQFDDPPVVGMFEMGDEAVVVLPKLVDLDECGNGRVRGRSSSLGSRLLLVA